MVYLNEIKKFSGVHHPHFNQLLLNLLTMYNSVKDANIYQRICMLSDTHQSTINIHSMFIGLENIKKLDIVRAGDCVKVYLHHWSAESYELYFSENNKLKYFSVKSSSESAVITNGIDIINGFITDTEITLWNITIPINEIEAILFQASTLGESFDLSPIRDFL